MLRYAAKCLFVKKEFMELEAWQSGIFILIVQNSGEKWNKRENTNIGDGFCLEG